MKTDMVGTALFPPTLSRQIWDGTGTYHMQKGHHCAAGGNRRFRDGVPARAPTACQPGGRVRIPSSLLDALRKSAPCTHDLANPVLRRVVNLSMFAFVY